MKLTKLFKVVAGAIALSALCFASPSRAASPAIDFSGFLHQNLVSNFTVGWAFTVGASSITVTELGFFDFGTNGLLQSHEVGLYSAGGTLLTSATVATTDTLTGNFRYKDITDIVLSANTTYVIGAAMKSSSDEFAYGQDPLTLTGLTVMSGITLAGNRFLDTGGDPSLAFPSNFTNSPAWTLFAGPNFKADLGGGGPPPVPEPGSVALLVASGFSGLGVALRNRKSRKR